MKKLFSILMIATLVVSCKNIEKDSQAIADFKCISFSVDDSLKIKEYDNEIKKIEEKWSGNELATLIATSNEIFNTKCTAKLEHEKKMKEYEKESKEFLKDFNSSVLESNVETDAYIRETDAMIDKINHSEDYETPYNGGDTYP